MICLVRCSGIWGLASFLAVGCSGSKQEQETWPDAFWEGDTTPSNQPDPGWGGSQVQSDWDTDSADTDAQKAGNSLPESNQGNQAIQNPNDTDSGSWLDTFNAKKPESRELTPEEIERAEANAERIRNAQAHRAEREARAKQERDAIEKFWNDQ